MGQHYIPKYYLNGFTDSLKPSNVWVYEKGSKRIFTTTVENVANENNRWPRDIEQCLANKIEEPAKPVLDKIRSRQPITESDKYMLSAYIAVMLQRVPKGLERMKEIAPKVIEEVFGNVKSDIQNLIIKYPEKKNILEARLQELPSYKSKYENEFPMEVWYKNLFPDAIPRFCETLRKMTWIFRTSDNIQPFLTSDNPIFFFKNIGIGNPRSEVTFPISSNVTLWATWHKNVLESYIPVKGKIVREINRRTASIATRYVYYSEEAQWVVNLINKKHPRLNRLT